MDILLGIIAIGLIYLLVGAAVAGLYMAPWLRTLSDETLGGILKDVKGLHLKSPQDIRIAQHAYVVSTIPAWPIYAYRVHVYGRHLTGR